eukprot:Gb_18222 [translate_table: standard]
MPPREALRALIASRRCILSAFAPSKSLPCLLNRAFAQAGLIRNSPQIWPHVPVTWFSTGSNANHQRTPQQGNGIGAEEARKLPRLANVEALFRKLEADGHEFISYARLLKACRSLRLAESNEEAAGFCKAMDDAGVILIFRGIAYLHPRKVAELIVNAVPSALIDEDDPRKQELEKLRKEKEEIERIEHRRLRLVLWTGLGCLLLQTALCFRLIIFWNLSWDGVAPITFFATTTILLVGYAYFLATSRNLSCQDFMTRLYLAKQKKLFRKRKFDVERFQQLQKQCHLPCQSETGTETCIHD